MFKTITKIGKETKRLGSRISNGLKDYSFYNDPHYVEITVTNGLSNQKQRTFDAYQVSTQQMDVLGPNADIQQGDLVGDGHNTYKVLHVTTDQVLVIEKGKKKTSFAVTVIAIESL